MSKSSLLKACGRPKEVKVPFSKAVTQIHQSPELLRFNREVRHQFEPSPAKKYGPNSAHGLSNTHLRFRGSIFTSEVSRSIPGFLLVWVTTPAHKHHVSVPGVSIFMGYSMLPHSTCPHLSHLGAEQAWTRSIPWRRSVGDGAHQTFRR